MDIEFNSEAELYDRVKPALKARANELRRIGLKYIKEEDIWNYLKETKWVNSKALNLNDIINNIMSCEEFKVDRYIKKKLSEETRTVDLEGDE